MFCIYLYECNIIVVIMLCTLHNLYILSKLIYNLLTKWLLSGMFTVHSEDESLNPQEKN